ncbi:MAG: cytochrome c3 family protein [Sutterellaceae bacterium]|nr:cytochrome c3 family protein [Sutterellaceae bacterium]MDD7442313.1 cytochrome c3 family protein [Sutterellaceae bacterium]MDY2868365.1 cytochrome c3 family protein [Mesosutterella sp.]
MSKGTFGRKAAAAALVLAAGLFTALSANAAGVADLHAAKGLKCDACHVTATGGALKAEKSDYGVCATCHGDYQKMIEKTDAKHKDSGQPNPHAQHDGALPCTECHKGHKASVNYCAQCHSFVYKVP